MVLKANLKVVVMYRYSIHVLKKIACIISGCYKLCEQWCYYTYRSTKVIIKKAIIKNSYYDGLNKPNLNYFRKTYYLDTCVKHG